MNICYISNSAAPSKNASSLQTAKLCEALSKIGNKVNLVLPDTGHKGKDYYNFYDIKSKFKIKRIKYFKKFYRCKLLFIFFILYIYSIQKPIFIYY